MPEGMEWTSIPEGILEDCSQLVKANSIEGNKKNNITIIYTPHANVKKTGDMAVGTVMFHNDCLLYTSPSPRDVEESRMPSSA